MKKNLNKKLHIRIEEIETVFFIIIASIINPVICSAFEWILPCISRQCLFGILLTMIAWLCINKTSRAGDFEEIEFEGDFNSLSSILYKELGLRISEKIDNHYVFKTQHYLLLNSSYAVMNFGDHCKIIARRNAGEIKKAINRIRPAQ